MLGASTRFPEMKLRPGRGRPQRFRHSIRVRPSVELLVAQGIAFFALTVFAIILSRSVTAQEFAKFTIWVVTFGLVYVVTDTWAWLGYLTGEVPRRFEDTLRFLSFFRGLLAGLISGATGCILLDSPSPFVIVLTSGVAGGSLSAAEFARTVAVCRHRIRVLAGAEIVAALSGSIPLIGCVARGADAFSFVLIFAWVALARYLLLGFIGGFRLSLAHDPSLKLSIGRVWRKNYAYAVMAFGARNLDNYVVGYVYGTHALGLYSRSYSLLIAPLMQISAAIGGLVTRDFSAEGGSPKRLWKWTSRLGLLAVMMVVLGQVVVPRTVVHILGAQWAPTVSYLEILSLCGACMLMQMPVVWAAQSSQSPLSPWILGSAGMLPLLGLLGSVRLSFDMAITIYACVSVAASCSMIVYSAVMTREGFMRRLGLYVGVVLMWVILIPAG